MRKFRIVQLFHDAYSPKREVEYVIPFKPRGSKIIETMEDTFEAAKNMSNYLS